jgi:hypothetical protein
MSGISEKDIITAVSRQENFRRRGDRSRDPKHAESRCACKRLGVCGHELRSIERLQTGQRQDFVTVEAPRRIDSGTRLIHWSPGFNRVGRCHRQSRDGPADEAESIPPLKSATGIGVQAWNGLEAAVPFVRRRRRVAPGRQGTGGFQ